MQFVDTFLHSGSLFSTSPTTVTIGWGKRTWHALPCAIGPSFYFPDFFFETKLPWCSHEFWREISLEALEKELESLAAKPANSQSPIKWQLFSKSIFKKNYKNLEKKILANILQKGVPYIFEVANERMNQERLKSSLLALLQTLRQKPIYGYGFWEKNQVMLGGTPDLLFLSH